MKHNGGVSVLGLLGILFVGLKMTGHIDWSWWWVTLPFWAGLAAITLLFVLLVIEEIVKRVRQTR